MLSHSSKKYTRCDNTVVILGAGFSRSLGVPDYATVLKTIASPLDKDDYNLDDFQHKIDIEITKHIRVFLKDVFACDAENGDAIPSLEQVFTFIDLSINTEHNLGNKYFAGKLRGLRRFLIYKLFLIIDKSYHHEPFVNKLFNFLSDSDFITLNWDIVLEQRLIERGKQYQYGVDEVPVRIVSNKLQVDSESRDTGSALKIAKVHGSANWAYCNNCRHLFYMKDRKIAKAIQSGIYVEDIKRFYKAGETDREPLKTLKNDIRHKAKSKNCPVCDCPLDTHIATFSYNKNFRTHVFDASWKYAEAMLEKATRWIFIGYSLPEADYEFLHMLKCVQRQTDLPKEIIVVLKQDANAEKKYKLLFGKEYVSVFNDGLDEFVYHCID
jgi:NAD-dependent SIR2 family protein deacetylase